MNLLGISPGGSCWGVVAAVSPFPWPGRLPGTVGGYVCLGGFVSSSRSSSWLCLFQTAKTLKMPGTGHGIPASLRPFGHAVCMYVTCVLAYQSLHGIWTQGKVLTASCPPLNAGQGFLVFTPSPPPRRAGLLCVQSVLSYDQQGHVPSSQGPSN